MRTTDSDVTETGHRRRSHRWARLGGLVAAATAGGALVLGGTPAQADQTSRAEVNLTGGSALGLIGSVGFDKDKIDVAAGGTLVVTNKTMGAAKRNGVMVSVAGQRQLVKDQPVSFSIPRSTENRSFPLSAGSSLVEVSDSATVEADGVPEPTPTRNDPPPTGGAGGGAPVPPSTGNPPPAQNQPVAPPVVPVPPVAAGGGAPAPALPPSVQNPTGGVGQPAPVPPAATDGSIPNGAQAPGAPQPPNTEPETTTAAGGWTPNSSGSLTLLVLVAAVIIAGVGSAAVRAMLLSRLRPTT